MNGDEQSEGVSRGFWRKRVQAWGLYAQRSWSCVMLVCVHMWARGPVRLGRGRGRELRAEKGQGLCRALWVTVGTF